MPKVYNAPPGFELNPVGMAKKCQELLRWKGAHAPRLEALQGLLEAAQLEAAKCTEARVTLDSERAANALLTDEVDMLRAELAAERERCAAWLEAEGRHDMAYGIRRGMHCVN